MRPKVLLFHPRTLHEKNYRYFYIPYSILSLVAPLHQSQVDIILVDNNVTHPSSYEELLSSLCPQCACIGISVMIGHQITYAISLSRAAKRIWPSIPVVWGGPCPSMIPAEVASLDCVDVLVRGQGERVFPQWLQGYLYNSTYRREARFATSEIGSKLVVGRPGEIESLNQFPSYGQSFEYLDLAAYVQSDEQIASRTVNYHSSQGCPYSCGFCCEVPLWGGHWSGLHPERILADLSILVEKYGINGIKFYDSDFFVRRSRAISFAQQLLSTGWGIRWSASSHPTNLLKLSNTDWQLLAKSGLARLLIGAESGNFNERTLLGKRVSDEQIKQLAKQCEALGIAASFTFVTGLPGGREEDIEMTLDFAKSLRDISPKHEAKVHFYAPYPGTGLFSLAISYGFSLPANIYEWAEYDYYNIVTPWIPDRYQERLTEFNRDHCPYVAESRFRPERKGRYDA